MMCVFMLFNICGELELTVLHIYFVLKQNEACMRMRMRVDERFSLDLNLMAMR